MGVCTLFKENIAHIQESLFDSSNIMNEGVKRKLEKSWAPIFYEHIFSKIDEKPFAVMYSDTGRPNFPVNISLALEYIKHFQNYTDDELVENFYFNYLLNYAVGIRTLGELNLAERTLYEFRSRIYKYTMEHPGEDDLIFGQFRNLVDGFAVTAGISDKLQRMDSTMFMSNIKKSGRLALAYDVLVKAVKSIPEEICSLPLKEVLTSEFKTDTLYRVKVNETDSKFETILNLCREALETLKSLNPEKETEELRIINRFLAEQAKYDEETDRLRARDKKEISAASLQSAYDEDATYRNKAGKSQSGYVANLSETCSKKNPFQLITDYKVAANITSDVELINERLLELEKNTGCKELYVDGGYYSQEAAESDEEQGIKINFTDMTGKTPKGNVGACEFELDDEKKIIKSCPKGIKPMRSAEKAGQFVAHFSLESCEGCELLDQCPVKKQKKSYVVRFSQKALTASKQRKLITENYKSNCSMRAGIEGTNSALKRRHGMSKLKVRGLAKVQVEVGLKVTAQNFRRLCTYLLQTVKKLNEPYQGVVLP
jgi:hypothetical protein